MKRSAKVKRSPAYSSFAHFVHESAPSDENVFSSQGLQLKYKISKVDKDRSSTGIQWNQVESVYSCIKTYFIRKKDKNLSISRAHHQQDVIDLTVLTKMHHLHYKFRQNIYCIQKYMINLENNGKMMVINACNCVKIVH